MPRLPSFLLSFVLLVTSMLVIHEAPACSVPFIAQELEFRGAAVLPENAKGKLFYATYRDGKYYVDGESSFSLHTRLPEEIRPESFTIVELDSRKRLAVHLERTSPISSPLNVESDFLILDPQLKGCVEARSPSPPEDLCNTPQMKIKDIASVRALVSQGKIQNVSDIFFKAQGEFFVAPVQGFEQGKRYYYRFSDSKLTRETAVEIVTAIDYSQMKISIDSSAVAKLVGHDNSNQYDCGPQENLPELALVKKFTYLIPEAFFPFREHMKFWHKIAPAPIMNPGTSKPEQDGKTFTPTVTSNMPQIFDYQSAQLPRTSFNLFMPCGVASPKRSSASLQVFASMPEMGGEVFKSPILNVEIGASTDEACSGQGLVDEVIASQNKNKINALICDIAKYASTDLDPEQVLNKLFALSEDQQSENRDCVSRAMTGLAKRVPHLKQITVEKILQSTSVALKDPNVNERQTFRNLKGFLMDLRERLTKGDGDSSLAPSFFHAIEPGLMFYLDAISRRQEYRSLNLVSDALEPLHDEILPMLLSLAEKNPSLSFCVLLSKMAASDDRVHKILLRSQAEYAQSCRSYIPRTRETDSDILWELLALLETKDQDEIISILRERKNQHARLFTFFLADQNPNRVLQRFDSMGKDAQSAAPLLLAYFKKLDISAYYEQLISTLQTIHAPKKIMRLAYRKTEKDR